MARMRWLQCVAGTSLALAMGCQTPNGPGTIRTFDAGGGAANVSAPRFPAAAAPGSPAAKSSSTLPPPVMPAISNGQTKIGAPAAEPGQVTTPGFPKLRPLDPSAAAASQQNGAFPPTNLGVDNPPRRLSQSEFNDRNFGEPKSVSPAGYNPVSGGRVEMPTQMPPPPLTSLPNSLPVGSNNSIAQPSVVMPQVSMPAIPSMPVPTFPSAPQFPSPPTMPNASSPPQSLPGNTPNLSTHGGAPQAIYTNP